MPDGCGDVEDDADESKPDPDIIQAALKRAKASPPEAIMIGDTPYDVEAARRAGVEIIAFRSGRWSDADLAGRDRDLRRTVGLTRAAGRLALRQSHPHWRASQLAAGKAD